MSQSPAVKGSSRLASIRPATSAEKRRAALLCADLVTDHLDKEDPEAKEALREWMDLFGLDARAMKAEPPAPGLYEEVGTP